MRIGVMDSGVGGLTVLCELVNAFPLNEYYYYGDNLNTPYGEKSLDDLFICSCKVIDFLISKEVELIVIACGTLSSTILSRLRDYSKVNIYDIISPTVMYISKLSNVGVIATENTINSKIFGDIEGIACNKLVPLIENGSDYNSVLKIYLEKFIKIDYLVLGCTHYPFLCSEIKEIMPNINLINMGSVLISSLKIDSGRSGFVRIYFGVVSHNLISNIDKVIDKNYYLEELGL